MRFVIPIILKFLLVCLSLLSCEKGNIYSNDTIEYIKKLRAVNDSIIVNIAYSSLNDQCPINTEEHFELAAQLGFNAMKTDLRLTKDGELVLCHDAGFTLNEKGRIISFDSANHRKIHDMKLSEVLALEHEAYYNNLGYYAHPTTLKAFLEICKKSDIIPYITIRNEYVDETVTKVLELLELYDLKERVIINNYPPSIETCCKIRDKAPFLAICYTIGKDASISTQTIDTVDSLGNAIICIHKDKLMDLSEMLWRYTMKDKNLRIFAWDLRSKQEYSFLIAKGCKGFQIMNKEIIK